MLRSLAAVLALAGAAGAQEPMLPGPKIDFPQVPGLTLSKPQVYSQPGLGYSISYKAQGLLVSIYVYDKQLKDIPTGVESEVVKRELKQAAGDLEAARKQGFYTTFQELGEDVVRLGKDDAALQALRRRYDVDGAKTGPARTSVLVTGCKNQFIKLRVTQNPQPKEAGEKLDALFEALGRALK